MLIDRCVVVCKSGKGGDGCVSFLHDKNTEFGGPDGGNGGKGGSVYFVSKNNLNTLFNFRHSRLIKASDGEVGHKKNMYGKNGNDIYVEVPTGTVIYEEKSGSLFGDLAHENDLCLVCKGGRGGRGNACFKSSRRRIPRFAENGYPGEEKRIILELKLVADVGIIGYPSVGKSTFLNIVTRSSSQVADYPFTTLVPNLGVCYLNNGKSFILADMPGLIDGASEGKGLGTTFLRHIERTRILLHFVSMESDNPYQNYLSINNELKKYNKNLELRPQIVVSCKMDLDGANLKKEEFDRQLGFKSLPLSSLTHFGVEKIILKASELLDKTATFPLKDVNDAKYKVYDATNNDDEVLTHIVKEHNYYRIKGSQIEQKASLYSTKTEEGIERLIKFLEKNDIEKLLQEAGVKDSDTVMINDFAFIYKNNN